MSAPRSVEVGASGAGDERFWALYEEAMPAVHGFLLRRSDRQTAEDLTQEVFIQLARRARRGDDLETLTTGWLLTVARTRLLDHLRAQRRAERKLRLAWSAADDEERRGIVLDDELGGALAARTERALEALSADERAALVLRHLDGCTVPEVAASLGRTVRATESLLARARRRFRAVMEDEADG